MFYALVWWDAQYLSIILGGFRQSFAAPPTRARSKQARLTWKHGLQLSLLVFTFSDSLRCASVGACLPLREFVIRPFADVLETRELYIRRIDVEVK